MAPRVNAHRLVRSPPIAVGALLRDALRRLRTAPLAILGAWVLLRIVAAAVLAPLGSAGTNWMIARSGRYVVANDDIVRFVLSPIGASALLLAAAVTVLSLSLARTAVLLVARDRTEEEATAVATAAMARRRRIASVARAVLGALRRTPVLAELAARQVAILLVVAAPLIAVVLLVAWIAVRGVDLYWLVTIRPTRFWVALAVLAPCAAVLAWLVALRLLRWSIALPLCVLEGLRPRQAMAESTALLRGQLGRVAAARLAWFAATSVVGAMLLAAVHLASRAVLSTELESLRLTAMAMGAALAAHAVVLTVEGLVAGAGDTLLVYGLWRRRSPGAARPMIVCSGDPGDTATSQRRSRALRWAVPMALLALTAAGAALSTGILASIDRPLEVELTAHRGASRAAPENTIAAIQEAMRLGADRIELDVMLTGDGKLAIFHDVDLRRMANDPRRIADVTLAELQQVDVGSWFDPAFADQRVPSLGQALEAAGWHAKGADAGEATAPGFPLNIELKSSGDDERLAALVAAALSEHGDDRSIVTSLSVRALEAYARVDPDRRVGAIVTASIGDLHRLDVDLYAVNAGLASSALIGRAHELDRQVHAWTVTDPDLLTRLVLRGVDGVIASDVVTIRARLNEMAALDDLERLLLAFRARLLE